MANWYVAMDGCTKAGVTLVDIGTSGYAASWAKAARWSDFQTAGGVWLSKVADNDTVIFLCALGARYPLAAITGGWTALNNGHVGLTFAAQTFDGIPASALFVGTRDWPWPKAGQTAAYAGETFMTLVAGGTTPTWKNIGFKGIQQTLTTSNLGASYDYGLVTQTACYALNTAGGLFYTGSKTDGRSSLVQTRCRLHGYSKGNARVWANDSGTGIVQTDCFIDSEYQNTNTSFGSATATFGGHCMDNIPGATGVKSPCFATRCIYINNAAGKTGGGYPQGDGLICEENTGTLTAKDILTWGNGDRGIDLKCAGTIIRHTDMGGGYGLGHHLDTLPIDTYQMLAYVGTRLSTLTSPPPTAAIQASGWTRAWQAWFSADPTAAQQAINPHAVVQAGNDTAHFQSSIYGCYHVARIEISDALFRVGTTAGATEQQDFSTPALTSRYAPVFGLTPGNSYAFKVRGVDPTGVAGPYTATVPFTMGASGGDMTGPAAPTGLTATPLAGGISCTFTWTSIAEDSGTAIQGYIMHIDFGDGNGYIPTVPGKTASPLTLSGFVPATAYSVKVAAYDANGNVGTLSGAVAFTTLSGSVSASTPSVPLNVGADPAWTAHPTMAALGNPSNANGWSAPATGVAALYEIADSSGVLRTKLMTCPGGALAAQTYIKTNVRISTV